MPTYPIVGAHFRPPAKAILQVLPGDCPLLLVPEPTNEFDPNAIAVHVRTNAIPTEVHPLLEDTAQGFGFTLGDILREPQWHLGYVPAVSAVDLAPQLAGQTYTGRLTFDAKGKPLVELGEVVVPAEGEEDYLLDLVLEEDEGEDLDEAPEWLGDPA